MVNRLADSSYLFLNEIRVHYLHWNLSEGSPRLVMLHGLASNARIWELVAPFLTEHGFAVLAPDTRGHGLTDKPEGDYSFDTFRNDLAALVNACDMERPVLVGHSWGASIALDYAAHFVVGPRAPAGIILVDGGMTQMDASGLSWEEVRDRLTPPRLAGTPLPAFLSRVGTHNSRWQPDSEAIQIILGNFEVTEDETIYPRLSFERHMQIVRAMWEFKTYERFSKLRCPVLAIPARPSEPLTSGERESIASKEKGLSAALERCSNLQVHWMEDSIHDIPLQRPADLAALIAEFITGLFGNDHRLK